jgi:hypothetical protein
LHGEKENFEEYSLNLKYAEFNIPILKNYSAEKCRPCPRATVYHKHEKNSCGSEGVSINT